MEKKTLQKTHKILRRTVAKVFENKFCKLFGFVEAAKFRDSGEFSDCVQNVGGKVTKTIFHSVKRPRNATSFLSRSQNLFPGLGAGWERGLDRKCYAL